MGWEGTAPGQRGKKGHHVLFRREKGDGVWVAKIYEPVDRPFCQTTEVKEGEGMRFNIWGRDGEISCKTISKEECRRGSKMGLQVLSSHNLSGKYRLGIDCRCVLCFEVF